MIDARGALVRMGATFGSDDDCQVRMYPAKTKPLHVTRSAAVDDTRPDLTRKADVCARVLAEARRLSRAGWFGPPLDYLATRAWELLEDMDEILVALDPARHGQSFAIAATLHRELEHVQAAIAERQRDAASASKVANRR